MAKDLADLGWANRDRFIADGISMDHAIERAIAAGQDASLPAMVFSDLGDNTGAGGPTNTLWMLEALHDAGAQGVLIVNFRDRRLVKAAQTTGIGNQLKAQFTGDDWGREDKASLNADADVLALHDGHLVGRRGIVAGKSLYCGPMALLDLGGVQVVVTSSAAVGNDPIYSEALGVDLSAVRTIVVKARSSFLRVDQPTRNALVRLVSDPAGETRVARLSTPWPTAETRAAGAYHEADRTSKETPMKDYPDVDAYLADSDQWPDEIAAIRPILLSCKLQETIKWGKPCYRIEDDNNIVLLQEFSDHLALMFFQGVLLEDSENVLHAQGPNTHGPKRMKFTSTADVESLADVIATYVKEAVHHARAGTELPPRPNEELATELHERLANNDELAEAFNELTPGRQREYNLHISAAKQPATRNRRIDKIEPRILEGKGLRDR